MDKANIAKGIGKNNIPHLDQVLDFDQIRIDAKVDLTAEIDKPPTAIEFHTGEVISSAMTLSNFSMLTGKAKSKKTFLLTSISASAITGTRHLDVIQGGLPDDKRKVIFFDTEQALYHASRMAKRICYQTGISDPDNLEYYTLRKYNPAERTKIIEHIIYNTPGLGIVFIDGGRDLLTLGINDEGQATQTTSDFLRWTAELNIHICMVLHQNKNDFNPRGHFGTECMNKAETVISVERSPEVENITFVKSEYQREIDFEPFAFFINDHGIPEAIDIPDGNAKQVKTTNPINIPDEKHIEVLDTIYQGTPEPLFNELSDSIIYHFNNSFGNGKCRQFIKHYLSKNWITKQRDGQRVIYSYNRATF